MEQYSSQPASLISNSAQAGGGIYNHGHLLVRDSQFTGNVATTYGGGAINHYNLTTASDGLTLFSTTLSKNKAQTQGGGIAFNGSNGELTLTNTTISSNIAQDLGGGLFLVSANATLTHVTFYNNVSASSPGDNIQNGGGSSPPGVITLKNTLAMAGTCDGTITDGGGNMRDSASTGCSAGLTNNALLGSLQDNGGWTPTHALPANSPARNAASNANCASVDQRGVTRPQNGQCDIGAFEYGAVPGLTGIVPNTKVVNSPAFTLTVNGSNFTGGPNGSRVLWDGTLLETTFINGNRLDALVPAGHLTTVGTANITVQTLALDGGTSGVAIFTIATAAPPPQLVFLPVSLK